MKNIQHGPNKTTPKSKLRLDLDYQTSVVHLRVGQAISRVIIVFVLHVHSLSLQIDRVMLVGRQVLHPIVLQHESLPTPAAIIRFPIIMLMKMQLDLFAILLVHGHSFDIN